MTGFIYEVSLSIDASIESDYLVWLREHIAEMLTLGCFIKARVFEQKALGTDAVKVFRVFYEFSDPVDFETYENKWASEMRNKFPAKFTNKVSIQRHILTPFRFEAL